MLETKCENCKAKNVERRSMMSILKYFKRSSDLPDPEGSLSKELDPYTICLVNEKVKSGIEESRSGKRGPYVQ